ncbi:unnamed protein product [Oppiella nova]|uniref:Uncharacterized protein n=1 Tax=Oppiella nova TaxID=334625 RepID=A0A7R9MBP1_9ACAR|nr:unnamed protein product [Oppiella nova]CAG2174424.1 unnamed protein product [Oppiella nova]
MPKPLSRLENSKWIAFGGSYPGSLAARFRAKYPHLTVGAVSSSAPMEARLNYKQFFEAVGEDLGTDCSRYIREATQQLDDELKAGPTGWESIKKQFNVCQPLNGTDPMDVNTFLFALYMQIGYSMISIEFEPNLPKIQTICDIMTNTSGGSRALDRYSQLSKVFLQKQGYKCLSADYKSYVKYMQNKTIPVLKELIKQWTYQQCNEFGHFPTTALNDQPFAANIPIEYFTQRCADIYGPTFTPQYMQKQIDYTNEYYGTISTINITNTVFINHSLDPWHPLGVLHDLNNSTKAIYIHGTGHGRDMYNAKPTDPITIHWIPGTHWEYYMI